jgi:hypothetical protein
MTKVNARDQYTCDKCQFELFPDYASGEWIEKKKKYFHEGDGIIQETEEK